MKIASGAELDWTVAMDAGQDLTEICAGAHYIAPENVEAHLDAVQRVCQKIDTIVAALKIRVKITVDPPNPRLN